MAESFRDGTEFKPEIQAIFDDPRYSWLASFGDLTDREPEDLEYDRELSIQAGAAVMQLISSEKQAKALKNATWGLVIATVGLVIATVVLIWVTATSGG